MRGRPAREEILERRLEKGGPRLGVPVDVRIAGERAQRRAISGLACERPCPAIARDMRDDERRVVPLELLVRKAEPIHHAWPVALDEDVRPLEQLAEDLFAALVLQVD